MADDCLHYLQAKLWILCFLCRLRKLQTCTASFVKRLAWSGQTDRLVAPHHPHTSDLHLFIDPGGSCRPSASSWLSNQTVLWCINVSLLFCHLLMLFSLVLREFIVGFVWCVVGVVLINGMPHGLYPMCLWTEYTSSFIFECMQNHTQGDGWASPQRPGSFPATEWVTFCMYQEWRCVWCVFLSSDGCCPTFCMNQEWRCVWCIFLSSDSYCPRHVCCINHAHSWGLHAQAASVPQTGALLRIALHEKCALWLFTSWLW